ncbi:alpha-ketoglutarate-dependent dioxygenase AlkB family protein [Tenacibaculum maritimum]|uniref:alpha-ketoglutarate-dependent dioxygenase AlkB family protein n=1 Tax=Tenacibaculum maritimum TaxID=107401 RepID=UPI0012E56F45|nr:alpha-ketoglutarate-dependent dioxygenase AlkB [Tenacibaculum maritimum]CAA0183204.1 DNA repair system specific for alkylated DNA [Tenacibaculum maritimum]
MDLFSQFSEVPQNLLPEGGVVYYYGVILSKQEADNFYKVLLDTIRWENDEAIVQGKHITTKRKVAWYGVEPFTYHYSDITKKALPFTSPLLVLKERIEAKTKETYNSCLLNLYHTGLEGMGWHSDGEKELKKNGAIASLTLGAVRKFGFKHKKTKKTKYVILEHGALLLMKGETQDNWLHRLPPTKKVHTPRINLTFRTIKK